jgi:hypothetical protein
MKKRILLSEDSYDDKQGDMYDGILVFSIVFYAALGIQLGMNCEEPSAFMDFMFNLIWGSALGFCFVGLPIGALMLGIMVYIPHLIVLGIMRLFYEKGKF